MTKSAELIGYFVPPEIWVKLVLQQLKLLQSAGTLHVLAAILRGSRGAEVRPYLHDITNMLTNPEICCVADVSSLLPIFKVIVPNVFVFCHQQ